MDKVIIRYLASEVRCPFRIIYYITKFLSLIIINNFFRSLNFMKLKVINKS